jgi:hypothetical protein
VQLRRIAVVASFGLLASCSDDKVGPGGVVTGSFSFNFGGGISGTYSASGTFPTNASQQSTSNWSAGQIETSENQVWVAAAVPASSTTHNYALLITDRTTVGTSTIVSSCSASNCADFIFLFGASNSSTAIDPAQTCFLTSGTINITSISSTRVTGTFSGAGNCVSSSNVTTSFTVTSGTFDVPLVAGLI